MNNVIRILVIFFYLHLGAAMAQQVPIEPVLESAPWKASWISSHAAMQREYGVYHFRKRFSLSTAPKTFVIHLTGDNKYRLFVNGSPVVSGPARGDLFNWFYESVDIAPFLKKGDNVIAALVWNMGKLAPVAQISNQTGFLLQGNTKAEELVNTDSSWKVYMDRAYSPTSLDNGKRLRAYMVVGPGDKLDGRLYPWGWEQPGFDDSSWLRAEEIATAYPVGFGTDNFWTLAPRNIPLFVESISRFPSLRRGNIAGAQQLIEQRKPVKIPSGHVARLLFDREEYCVGYPEIVVSGGIGAQIKLTYAESLFDSAGNKGNRNEIEDKQILGNYDVFIAEGGIRRMFRPLWIRAYRYVEVEITTTDDPLVLEDFYGMATGYPFELNASFECSDPSLSAIWKVGWRTAQSCAGDLYYDTPYYEQLQYTGDSRIQALISLYCTGDERLMRKAILDFYRSRTPEGLTQGRYPSNRLQIIPPFSLFWVSMVHDYWMHKKDDAFVRQFLPAIAEVLTWYQQRVDQKTGMLGPMKWWNFTDWDNFNGWGVAPGAEDGNAAIISLQAAYTFKQAAELFAAFGEIQQSRSWEKMVSRLNRSTYINCFDDTRNLFADVPQKTSFSQHASIWAILSGAVSGQKAKVVMQGLLSDKSIGQVTFFYRFYLTQALKKAGMADEYYAQLGPWRDMIKLGLTTFAEKPEPTRSDCHAWSASPNYDFLSTICGIMPSAAGFRAVEIAPALGPLTWVKGSMAHPAGLISIDLKRSENGAGISGSVELPSSIKGEFIWMGKRIALAGGRQEIKL